MGTNEPSRCFAPDAFLKDCPSREVLEAIAGKWTVLALAALESGEPRRYGAIKQRLEGVSPKMLAQTLRGLERNGLVTRTQYPTIPPKVEYQLTALGQRLGHLVQEVKRWSEDHYPAIAAARDAFDAAR